MCPKSRSVNSSGRRCAYRWVTSTDECPIIAESFSMEPPPRTHREANVWRVAWYQLSGRSPHGATAARSRA
jgi:hypothetical protein